MREFEDYLTIEKVVNLVMDNVGDKASKRSSNNFLSPRWVYEVCNAYRAKLIREKKNRRQELSPFLEQVIPCIKLKKVSQNECPCEPIEPCSFLKTIHPVPVPVKLTSVTTTNGKQDYGYVDWNKFQFKLASSRKWKHDWFYYTLKSVKEGTDIYIYTNKNTLFRKHLALAGIFYNQLEVQRYPNCDGVTPECKSPLDFRFVYDPDHISTLVEMATQFILGSKQGTVSDILNDGNDNTSENTIRLK